MRGLRVFSIILLTITIARTVSLRLNSNKISAWRLFRFSSEAQANAVRPEMGLRVGGNSPYDVENTITILDVREKWCPGAVLVPDTFTS